MILLSVPFFSVKALNVSIEDSDIIVNTTPSSPEPYQNTTIELSSYSTNLNKASIEWKTGSKVLLSGIGKTKYSFQTSGPNISVVFNITINPAEGGDPVNKRVVITPSEIEMLWEAVDGYVPPFYKGKAFVPKEGSIKVVAIPNTNTIKSSKGDVEYLWKNGDTNDQDASGYNKDSFIFRNKVINSTENISVTASSIDNNYSATSDIEVPIVDPKIIFYKKSPTEGILYNKALVTQINMPENEMTIVAVPYFLSVAGNENNIQYTWNINGKEIETPSKENELTVNPTDRGGYAVINLVIENLNLLFQKVNNTLRINL